MQLRDAVHRVEVVLDRPLEVWGGDETMKGFSLKSHRFTETTTGGECVLMSVICQSSKMIMLDRETTTGGEGRHGSRLHSSLSFMM